VRISLVSAVTLQSIAETVKQPVKGALAKATTSAPLPLRCGPDSSPKLSHSGGEDGPRVAGREMQFAWIAPLFPPCGISCFMIKFDDLDHLR
jgi:hypothetical protein